VAGLPPAPFPSFNKRVMPAGTRLVRVHDRDLDGDAFNAGFGAPTRFAPVWRPDGSAIATLYGGSTLECAVHESLFHDLPYDAPGKFIRLDKITSRAISYIETTSDLILASLHEPDLNRLGLTRADLIDTPRADYAVTARWAEAFHRAGAGVAGLVWTSRRCDPEQAYVLFADRVPPGALALYDRVEIGASAPHLREIAAFGRRAGITLTI
jgi:RES domain